MIFVKTDFRNRKTSTPLIRDPVLKHCTCTTTFVRYAFVKLSTYSKSKLELDLKKVEPE